MNLPNYFLADLPPETTLSPVMITEACQTLKRNRERYLATRSTQNLVDVLSALAGDWLAPDHPFRKLALEQGPAAPVAPVPAQLRVVEAIATEPEPEISGQQDIEKQPAEVAVPRKIKPAKSGSTKTTGETTKKPAEKKSAKKSGTTASKKAPAKKKAAKTAAATKGAKRKPAKQKAAKKVTKKVAKGTKKPAKKVSAAKAKKTKKKARTKQAR